MIALALALLFASPRDYLDDAKGRIHASGNRVAQVENWRDNARDCTSSFDLVRDGATTVRWTIDWKRVRNVQISTRKHFMTDVEETRYHEQPGLIFYGRNTTSATLPDGAKVEFDNLEFFLKDVTQMDYAYTGLRDHARTCRRR